MEWPRSVLPSLLEEKRSDVSVAFVHSQVSRIVYPMQNILSITLDMDNIRELKPRKLWSEKEDNVLRSEVARQGK